MKTGHPLDPTAARSAGPRGIRARPVIAAMTLIALLACTSLLGLLAPGNSRALCCASPPSAEHLLGTAADGSDLASAVARGVGTTLAIVVVATVLALLLGVSWGATAAVLPPRAERTLMKVLHLLDAAPLLLLLIAIVVLVRAVRPSVPAPLYQLLDSRIVLTLGLAGVGWRRLARVAHARIASLRRRPFVEMARALGLSRTRVWAVHLAPHTAGPLVAYAVLALPGAIATEGFLSFLGLGVETPQSSLGTLLASGAGSMAVAPLTLLLPACALVTATVAFHVVGIHLRDALEPERHEAGDRW